MNIGDDVVNISDVPPLALLDLAGKIMTAKKLHCECLGELYARYRVLLKQIREEKDITIKELSALCGSSSDFLQAAESGSLEVTDDNLKSVQDVYWTVATGEEHPGDFKRLANERLATQIFSGLRIAGGLRVPVREAVEGVFCQAEWLYDHYVDLKMNSILRMRISPH